MKVFLWVDDDDNLHFNDKEARAWALRTVNGKQPQTYNIQQMPTPRFIKYFWDAVVMTAYSMATDGVFVKSARGSKR